MKQEVFTVTAKDLSRYAEGYDFKVGKLENDTTSADISVFIHTICGEILADSEDSDEIQDEVVHTQALAINGVATTNLLMTCVLYKFFIYK